MFAFTPSATEPGYFSIRPKQSLMCLDVLSGAYSKKGGPIRQKACADSVLQLFRVSKLLLGWGGIPNSELVTYPLSQA